MLLSFLTIVFMLGAAYAFLRQGVLAALAMTVNVLLAGLAAFASFEPMADALQDMFAGSFLHNYEDSLCLIFVFILTLMFLRWASNALIHGSPEYHPALQQGGAVLFGLMIGYLTAGFLLCAAQTMPLDKDFMNFKAGIDTQSSASKIRHVLPPDRVWLALMHRASTESLGWDDNFDRDGSFELRYEARRKEKNLEAHE